MLIGLNAPRRRKLCHAPRTGRSCPKFMLKRADPACDGRGSAQLRDPFPVTGGGVGAHNGTLVGSIFMIYVHFWSPIWGGNAETLPRIISSSVNHHCDKVPQVHGLKHGEESHVPCHWCLATD